VELFLLFVLAAFVIVLSSTRLSKLVSADETGLTIQSLFGKTTKIEWKKVKSPIRISGALSLLFAEVSFFRESTRRSTHTSSSVVFIPHWLTKDGFISTIPDGIIVSDWTYPK
jgi:hypothetical protein